MDPSQQLPSDTDSLQNVHNPFAVMQPGEKVICEIRRHPIGLIGVYIGAGLLGLLALVVAVAAPYVLVDVSQQIRLGVVLGAALMIAAVLLYAYIATIIYKANRWIVTSDSITQITQISLFNKHTSQLSLANLEDVTVEQDGVLQSMFGFGSLRAETAGERSRFTFIFCPNPNEYARKIIGAHEAYIADKPRETFVANQSLNQVHAYNQPSFNDPTQQPPADAGPSQS